MMESYFASERHGATPSWCQYETGRTMAEVRTVFLVSHNSVTYVSVVKDRRRIFFFQESGA